ncbi:MAG: hypothetical protein H8E44_21620 [Planctomycetes bacterium]|nr:hypothetical protein [Planctomycetota bacterium]
MFGRGFLSWGMTWMLTLAAMPVLGAQEPQADVLPDEWWSIERYVVEQLQERNVSQWARELSAEPWGDEPGQWMLRFSVLHRAGHEKTLSRLIDALAKAKHQPRRFYRQQMAETLIGSEWWEPAQQFCERMPGAHVGWLVDHWQEAGRDPKWIDAWLAARDRDDQPSEEELDYLGPSRLRYWFARRLDYRQRQGTAGLLIEELAKAVRDDPADADAALRYLAAVRRVGLDDYDPAWIGAVAKPEFVVPCYDLGRSLAGLRPKAGIPLLLRSLELKYSDEDDRIMKQRSRRWARAFGQTQSFEQMIRDGTRHELMYAYKKAGDAKKAQALLEELTKRYPNGIPPTGMAQFAGQTQGASGARVIENRIRKAEPEKKDSYEYWQKRGQYFAGRKERDEAIQAYEKALELAKPAPYEIEQGQGENFARALVLGDYVRLLGWNDKGMRLLWPELKATDPKTAYATRIVRMMLDIERDNTYYMEPDDDRLWAVLEARPKWDIFEQSLLMRFAKNAQPQTHRKRPDRRPELWTRGEKLAKDADPSRADNLAWVMTRYGGSRRAIPLLTDVLSRQTDAKSTSRASFTLFEAYLDVGDWRAAEETWPAARKLLHPREQPAWLGRIAMLAAKAGGHADALRIWRKRMNYDLTDLRGLDSLAEIGMRDQLAQLYRQLAIDDPESIAPDAALRSMERDD